MLKIIVILIIFTVTVNATGELTILHSPKSLSFKDNEALNSDDLGDLLLATTGNSISGYSKWSGFYINDPFHLPRNILIVHLNGVNHTALSLNDKTYTIVGQGVQQSLNAVGTLLETEGEKVCTINFEHFEESMSNLMKLLGESAIKLKVLPKTKHLNAKLYDGYNQFMLTLDLIDAMSSNMEKLLKKCRYISVHMTLYPTSKEYDVKSPAMIEALELFTKRARDLISAAQMSSHKQILILGIANKDDHHTRVKRADDVKIYNLAEFYNEDYPVIFNIILWFMVVFAFCLLAISYTIGTMDPGRDSIIYRMTSTRMKKDN